MSNKLQRWTKIQGEYFKRWHSALSNRAAWDFPYGYSWMKDPRTDRWYKSYHQDKRTKSKEYWNRMAKRYRNKLKYANRKVASLHRRYVHK